MDTLFLHPKTWDLDIDTSRNIALANAPYAVAQDIASAVKLFLGEAWFDTTQGVPWFQQVLGRNPSLSLIKSLIEQAALTVPDVKSAVAVLTSNQTRVIGGQIQATMTSGTIVTVDL